ncbi:MAG: SDR family NAD(P)-dependent oxidoreductase, partial [Nocardiopsaceae bacterium]|nr:SDR family NAD(P)-dependent oxidoreductase [Nocardiopsaceae bacterium]
AGTEARTEDAPAVTGTLRRDDGGPARMLAAVATAWAHGAPIDWTPAFPGGRTIELPTYAFQRHRYWTDIQAAREPDRREGSPIDDWRYRVEWQPVSDRQAPALAGTWLVRFDERAGYPQQVVTALTEHGAEVIASDRRAALPAEVRFAGVVSLLGFEDNVTLLQSLGDRAVPLWLVTQGGVSVGPRDTPPDPRQAMVWGFGVTAGLEHPRQWGGLVDLPGTLDAPSRERFANVLSGISQEEQVAVRSEAIFVRRLVAAPRTADRTWQPRGSVLVTGGTGGVGAHLARWLGRSGAGHIILISRSGPQAPGAGRLAGELGELGVRVTILACDTADRDGLAALADAHTITAVLHAAGTQSSIPIADLTPADIARLARPKIDGAANLDELFGQADLDAFVLFTSGAGVWGSAGRAAYGAANAYLDALAQQRRARGLPATAVAWGVWADGGMSEGALGDQLRARGVRAMAPERAIAALSQAVGQDETCLAVADIDWPTFVPTYTLARRRPLIEALPEVRRVLDAPRAAPRTALLPDRLRQVPEPSRERAVLDLVLAEIAGVLGHPSPDAVPPNRPFKDMGFDSVTAVELRDRLAVVTGLRLPATLVFDHPTPSALAGQLFGLAFGEQRQPGRTSTGPLSTGRLSTGRLSTGTPSPDEPVAIVAMGCRFPGGVRSPEDLWRLVRDGIDAIVDFPTDRGWEPDSASYPRAGGFIPDAGDFDAAFFGISPREALAMDPQQRLLLEVCWETFERAGIDPDRLRGSATGVFTGSAYQGYAAMLQFGSPDDAQAQGVSGHLTMGNMPSAASGRLAYTFGLEGPAVSVDTACSSSLVALHLACQSLRAGECDLALAGGAAVSATPAGFIEFGRLNALSPDGRCRSFAADADGTGWAEGAGLVLLERLSDARANGHRVRAVVRGSAVNQDGASNGLTAPNGPSQERVIRAALASAGLKPADVDVVEGHGTGTVLGDPIEIQALQATYGQDRPAERPLWIGSVKSNIGHAQAAAGVAGIIKMVQAMTHARVPGTLHADTPSAHVDWSEGSVLVAAEAVEWPRDGDRPRRAGVSAFGGSGTNAHVILECAEDAPRPDAPRPDTPPPDAPPPDVVPLVLSARGEAALRARARQLLSFPLDQGSLTDVAASLATTRAALDHRAVVVAADREAAERGLTALADGQPEPGLVTGVGSGGRAAFVFPGQGGQWAGMGAELAAAFPGFAERLAGCAAALDPLTG